MSYKIIYPEDFKKVKLPGLTKWLEALRSGLPQCNGYLATTSVGVVRYCCLGVLSKVQGRLTDKRTDGKDGDKCYLSNDNPLLSILGRSGKLPFYVTADGMMKQCQYLSELNDSLCLNFLEIADILEAAFIEPKEEDRG